MSKKLIFLISLLLALGLVSAARAADPSLLGWYRFEGNAADSSDYANHGTAQGGPLWISGPPGYGGAVRFDGADDYVGTGKILLANVSQFTMAGWVAAGNPTASRIGLFGQNDVIEMGFNGGNISIWISAGGATTQTAWTFPNLTWHHVAVVADASMKIYLDGQLAVTGTGAANYGTSTYPFNIGGGGIWDATGNWFSGSMDEVRVYNRALTQAEVQALAVRHEATNPSPADGSAVAADVVGLAWAPGGSAVLHDVYFSDSFADVNAARSSDPMGPDKVYKARQSELTYPPGPFETMPVTRGETYYWRIDEVNGVNVWRGNIWSFTVVPNLNWNPNPAHQATYVPVTTDLSWSKGNWAVKGHIIYLSTDFATVNNKVPGTMSGAGYLGFTNNPATTTIVIPGDLLYNTTYYWRVDPIVSAPPVVAQKGNVWSFTTLPRVDPIDPNLAGWWKLEGEAPALVFDYSGHANHGTPRGNPQVVPGHDANALHFDGIDDYVEIPHSNILSVNNEVTVAAWINAERLSGPGGAEWQGILAKGESPRSYSFYTTTAGVLHFSTAGVGSTSTLLVTTNEWTHVAAMVVGGVHRYYINGTFAGEGGTGIVLPGTTDSAPVRIAATQEASRQFLGAIDDVRIYNKALSSKEIKVLAGRLGATDPDPADGATDVQRTLTLSWEPGAYAAAVNGHRVYFDADQQKVIDRAGCQVNGTFTIDPCYPLPWTFGLEETFYWAVDEVNGVKSWAGDLWSFTTANNKVVDDMETYTPWDVPDNNIFEVWVDGPGNCKPTSGNNTGALVDISTLAGLTPVHGGQQAMKYAYDNDGTVDNPCKPGETATRLTYSKAEAQVVKLPSGIGSDWTVGGTKSLSLWFYGDTFNSIEPMWVQLTDASNNKAKVLYGKYADEDVNDVNEASWHEWLIDLADFNVPPTRVNVKNIKSIAIGIGNEPTGPAGGSGTLYFDDIRLYTPRCVLARREAAFAKFDYAPEGTPGGDCVVNGLELEIMTRDWLQSDREIAAVAPNLAGRKAWYKLDGNANDSSPNAYNGTENGGPVYVAGHTGQAVSLDGVDDYVEVAGGVGITGGAARTIAGWAKANSMTIADWTNVFGLSSTAGAANLHFDIEKRGGQDQYCIHVYGWEQNILPLDLEWHHFAATYDGTTIVWYGDGIPVGSDSSRVLNSTGLVRMGKRGDTGGFFPGLVDEVTFWNVALTENEIASVRGLGTVYVPVASPSNVSDSEAVTQKKVNFKDYSELVLRWLDENEWPLP